MKHVLPSMTGLLLVCATCVGEPATLKEAFKDDFLIGAALNPAQFSESNETEADIVKTQFNSITAENVTKWGRIHPRPDHYNFEPADRYVEFGLKNNMFVVGHTLVWHSQTPRWVFRGEGTNTMTRELLLQRMRDHIMTVVGRYKGKVKGWDVVNEALNEDGSLRDSPWRRIIGDDYIVKAFQYAHEADPDAELYYNDFSIENEPKRNGAVTLIKQLQAAGVRIDGVGIQEHVTMAWPTAAQLDETLTAFEQLGVKTMVTELDVDVLPRRGGEGNAEISWRMAASPAMNPYTNGLPAVMQKMLANRYAELFGVYLKHRGKLERVTLWGVTDRNSWLNHWPIPRRTSYPLLFDREGEPKKCFDAVIEAASQGASEKAPVKAAIDASKTGPPVSPYVYGQFLEHIGNLIYRSLWSEMLDDRKFYYAVGPQPQAESDSRRGGGFGGRRRGVGPGRWNPVGPDDSVVMDTNNPFVGDHTPWIKLAGSEPRGIRQTGLSFVKGETYKGRVQLAGDSGAKVSVRIVWGTNADAEHQSVDLGQLGQDYQKFTFSFKAAESGPAQFEIVGTGTGSFHVGAVSLMPADNIEGFKPDAIAALKSLRSGVYRFPGGNFVSAHEWRDAIGDPDKRPPVMDPVWHAVQPNDIGTDEFMTLCRLLDVEPYVTVNAGFGDAWSAAQYVEYANGPVTTPMGRLRAANGHPEPYHVKFWGIGNEAWGDWQFGAMSLTQFEYKHNQFAKAMRKVDPSIQLIASGAMPDTMTGSKQSLRFGTNLVPPYLSPGDWTGGLLEHCFDNIDLISEHFYNYGNTHFSLAEGRQVPNDPEEPVTDWMRRPANHIRIKYEEYKEYEKRLPQLVTHPKPLNIDEWAYMGGPYPTYPSYAWVFHEMSRHSDIFQMAAYTFATSLLAHNGTNTSLNGNGLVFKIYRDHFGSIPVEVTGNSPQPNPTDPPGGEQPVVNAGSDTFPLDVVAAWTEDHRALTVAVLNPTDVGQSLALEIGGAPLSGKGTLWRLESGEATGQNPSIGSSPMDSVPTLLALPRFSVSIYEFPVRD